VPKATIPISEFKATCLSVLEQVRQSGSPVIVTRFGVPIAEITPPPPPERAGGWVGKMIGTGEILEDLVKPAIDLEDWSVLR
jgi:prevent-host-death family protein